MNMRELTLEEKIDDLKRSMTNHKPDDEQLKRIEAIREYYKNTGEAILKNCPQSRNSRLAITALEESLMRAVRSIVLEGF